MKKCMEGGATGHQKKIKKKKTWRDNKERHKHRLIGKQRQCTDGRGRQNPFSISSYIQTSGIIFSVSLWTLWKQNYYQVCYYLPIWCPHKSADRNWTDPPTHTDTQRGITTRNLTNSRLRCCSRAWKVNKTWHLFFSSSNRTFSVMTRFSVQGPALLTFVILWRTYTQTHST